MVPIPNQDVLFLLRSHHLTCVYDAGTSFGTDQTTTDVYELGFSYLFISVLGKILHQRLFLENVSKTVSTILDEGGISDRNSLLNLGFLILRITLIHILYLINKHPCLYDRFDV